MNRVFIEIILFTPLYVYTLWYAEQTQYWWVIFTIPLYLFAFICAYHVFKDQNLKGDEIQ
jgi:hypothetical protein